MQGKLKSLIIYLQDCFCPQANVDILEWNSCRLVSGVQFDKLKWSDASQDLGFDEPLK